LSFSCDGDSFWAGADDATMSDVDLDLEVVGGADELADAAGLGDLARMSSLLDDWVDMYAAENAGGKALLAAATAGRTDSLQFLFARSDSHPDAVFRQAIRAAAGVGHEAALQEILAQDLVDARSAPVQEALGAAAQGGKSNAVTS